MIWLRLGDGKKIALDPAIPVFRLDTVNARRTDATGHLVPRADRESAGGTAAAHDCALPITAPEPAKASDPRGMRTETIR